MFMFDSYNKSSKADIKSLASFWLTTGSSPFP
eukprot:UN17010